MGAHQLLAHCVVGRLPGAAHFPLCRRRPGLGDGFFGAPGATAVRLRRAARTWPQPGGAGVRHPRAGYHPLADRRRGAHGTAARTALPGIPDGGGRSRCQRVVGPALALVLVVWEGPRQAFARTFSFLAPWLYVPTTGRLDARTLLSVLLLSNVLLALFNLLPAFPMDGGRMLRAFLAAFLSRRLATQIASYAGQVVAGPMMLAGLFGPNRFLILVGFLVCLGAGAERQQVVSAESLRGLQARQAMQPIGPRLHPLQTLGETAAQVAALPQSAYLVVDGGRLTGLLGRHELLGALRKAGPQARISQFVERDVLRVRPEEQLLSVQSRMLEHRTWVAVVVEDGCVSGLLTGSAMTRLMEVVDACPAALKSAGY